MWRKFIDNNKLIGRCVSIVIGCLLIFTIVTGYDLATYLKGEQVIKIVMSAYDNMSEDDLERMFETQEHEGSAIYSKYENVFKYIVEMKHGHGTEQELALLINEKVEEFQWNSTAFYIGIFIMLILIIIRFGIFIVARLRGF